MAQPQGPRGPARRFDQARATASQDDGARLPHAHDRPRLGDRAAAHDGQVPAGDDDDPRWRRRHARQSGDATSPRSRSSFTRASSGSTACRPTSAAASSSSCRASRSTTTCKSTSSIRCRCPTPASAWARRRCLGFAANYIRTGKKELRLMDDPETEHVPEAPGVPLRRRRPRRDVGGLPALRADAAQRRRARRRAHPRSQDDRADVDEPSARRRPARATSRRRAATARPVSTASASG